MPSQHTSNQKFLRHLEAIADSHLRLVWHLVRRFQRDIDRELPSYNNLQTLLEGYLRYFDKLFFFGLLRRRVRRMLPVPRMLPMVALKVIDEQDERLGDWQRDRKDEIRLWTRDSHGEYHALEDFVTTVAHEMIHAYLRIFSDESAASHFRCVDADGGHGVMFWHLHHFILSRLCTWIGTPRLRAWRDETFGKWLEAQQLDVSGRQKDEAFVEWVEAQKLDVTDRQDDDEDISEPELGDQEEDRFPDGDSEDEENQSDEEEGDE
ncbi:Uu.00g010080.m01.CDS01 [Anthostomella pinea]|uniref:Uu.00g010080.m01.CDS01 n=1 Tax=Anthostomella pinea TaxID=933095 RepID=A0AAI8YPX3_9PEZI|nr:Uu.00g010080.m01.CDS01 [Anthostomella pinea]